MAAAAFLATFIAGALAGAAGGRMLGGGATPLGATLVTVSRQMPGALRGLGLSADQERAIQSVFDRHQPRSDSLLRTLMPAVRAITDTLDAEVRAILTPSQRAQLDRMRRPEPTFLLKHRGPFDSTERVDTLRR